MVTQRIYNTRPHTRVEYTTRGGISFSVRTPDSYESQCFLAEPTATARTRYQGHHIVNASVDALNGKHWREVVRPRDLVVVYLQDRKGKEWPDFVGEITDIQDSYAHRDGRPVNAIEINYKGLGDALRNYQIFWHSHMSGVLRNNLAGLGFLVRSQGQLPAGRPDQVLTFLFDTFYNDKYARRVASGKKISELIDKRFSYGPNSGHATALAALGAQGRLWDLMKRYSDAPWNELFLDVVQESGFEGGVGLYFRPTPWDLDRWNALAVPGSGWSYEYDDTDLADGGESLHWKGDDAYNFFWCSAKSIYTAFDQLGILFDQSGGKLPIYDAEGIALRDLRKLEVSTEYVEYVNKRHKQTGKTTAAEQRKHKTKQGTLWAMLYERTVQLQNWFGYDNFYEGSIQLVGRVGRDPRLGIRLGSVLHRDRDDWQFYVTGIQQSTGFNSPHVTTVTVEKGRAPRAYQRWVGQNEKKRQSKKGTAR